MSQKIFGSEKILLFRRITKIVCKVKKKIASIKKCFKLYNNNKKPERLKPWSDLRAERK